jgi:hypothetical protein
MFLFGVGTLYLLADHVGLACLPPWFLAKDKLAEYIQGSKRPALTNISATLKLHGYLYLLLYRLFPRSRVFRCDTLILT